MSIVWVVTVYFTSLYMSQSRKSHFSPRRALFSQAGHSTFLPIFKILKINQHQKNNKSLKQFKKM